MTPTPMARLADARPEIAQRPHTVVSPTERAELLRSITGSAPTVSPYVVADDEVVELDLGRRGRLTRRPALLAAAVIVVLAAIGLGVVLRGGGPDSNETGPAGPPSNIAPSPLPAGFDQATATPVFTASGDADAVAHTYLVDRFGSSFVDMAVEPAVVDGDQAVAAWAYEFGEAEDATPATPPDTALDSVTGAVLLRRVGADWTVVASRTDDVDLSSVRRDGNRVVGTVVNEDVAKYFMVADVLTTNGVPVAGHPYRNEPDDLPGVADDLGSATSDAHDGVLDVPVGNEPVVLRVALLGGGMFGLSEVALDVGPSVGAPDPASVTPGSLPAWFDPATASAIFTGDGDVNAVLGDYIADRFDPANLPVVRITEDAGDRATAVWTFGTELEGTIASGSVFLRQDPPGWSVVASTIDDVDLSAVALAGGRVAGTATSTNQNNLALDVLTAAGEPVAEAPEAGNTDVDGSPFGTAGMGTGRLDLDLPVDGPVVLRAELVGGTTLGVAELALDPPPFDMPGDGWTVRVEQRFDGTCIGLASGDGRVCTSAADQLWPADVYYLQLGPTVRRGDQVIVTGLVSPEVATLQARTADGRELDGGSDRVEVDGVAFVVLSLPVVDGPVTIDLQDIGAQVVDTVELAGLLPVGG